MASWGLAFEYGKNAYMDMMKKQEELDRYLAERDLWEMELRTKEATARATQAEAERTSENSVILSQYADDILAGDYDAYANALSKVNPNKQFKHIGGGIIAQVDPSNPRLTIPESARDISKIEPSKLVSEIYKSATSIGMISKNEMDAEADRLKHQRTKELKKMDADSAERVATINAQGRIEAAKISAGGGSSSSGPRGGKTSRINLSDKDREYLDSTVAQTLFGSGVRGVRTEDGGWEVYDKKGAPVPLKDEDIRDLEEVHRTLLISTSNLAQSNSGDLKANIASAASLVSRQIKHNKDYNEAWTAYDKGLTSRERAVNAAKEAYTERKKWENVDLSTLPELEREAAERALDQYNTTIETGNNFGMPVWDEKRFGKRGDSLRPLTYGIGLSYKTPSEETESKSKTKK